ncbi:uncharacterized protein METZ01_LOCUS437282, partial [marine metagenome]
RRPVRPGRIALHEPLRRQPRRLRRGCGSAAAGPPADDDTYHRRVRRRCECGADGHPHTGTHRRPSPAGARRRRRRHRRRQSHTATAPGHPRSAPRRRRHPGAGRKIRGVPLRPGAERARPHQARPSRRWGGVDDGRRRKWSCAPSRWHRLSDRHGSAGSVRSGDDLRGDPAL